MYPLVSRLRHNLIKGYRVSQALGIDPRRLASLAYLGKYLAHLRQYNRTADGRWRASYGSLWPVLHEFRGEAGAGSGHYFHQDLWAARKVFAVRPVRHVDIGSRVDGFVAHLLVFMPVEYVDIRPLPEPIANLTAIRMDATALHLYPDDSVLSLSSLNAAEHFGLGRFSDPIDPMACFTFMSSLGRVLAPGGRLYFSTPIGRERVEFNAHRVFALNTVLAQFARLRLLSFSYVDDDGRLHEDVRAGHFPSGADHACGLFEFTKDAPPAST